jgi:PAS domain S-box-containing protein
MLSWEFDPQNGQMSSRETGRVGDPLLSRLRALFNSLPALIAYWNGDLRNAMANVALLKWYGMTPEQLHGMHIRDVLGLELYEKDSPFIAGALRGEEQLLEGT